MLPLDTACDLVKRFAEARAPVFFLDQAGQQVGFSYVRSGLNMAAV